MWLFRVREARAARTEEVGAALVVLFDHQGCVVGVWLPTAHDRAGHAQPSGGGLAEREALRAGPREQPAPSP